MSRHIVVMKLLVMCCIVPKSLLSHLNSFHRGMAKLNVKFDADSLLYSLSHFDCDGHTVHTLTEQCLPPPLTSTVMSSLFMHVHSGPLSLAARSHHYCANCFHYVNSGCTISGQTSCAALARWLSWLEHHPEMPKLWIRPPAPRQGTYRSQPKNA